MAVLFCRCFGSQSDFPRATHHVHNGGKAPDSSLQGLYRLQSFISARNTYCWRKFRGRVPATAESIQSKDCKSFSFSPPAAAWRKRQLSRGHRVPGLMGTGRSLGCALGYLVTTRAEVCLGYLHSREPRAPPTASPLRAGRRTHRCGGSRRAPPLPRAPPGGGVTAGGWIHHLWWPRSPCARAPLRALLKTGRRFPSLGSAAQGRHRGAALGTRRTICHRRNKGRSRPGWACARALSR